ncbi:MAG: aldose 1-epimerase [Burkholderiales bacterium]|nr:aldose 1-epimerase [Burkholderiales bacterium]
MSGLAIPAPVIRLEAAGQRLGLVPALGGGVAEWCLVREGVDHHLWRPWSGASNDRYSLASFAMLPWSNRISGGGFEHRGRFEPMRPNRAGEPYPIHGDGWLQPWQVARQEARAIEIALASRGHGGNPYHYEARQRFELHDDGLEQSVSVVHLGERPLPYGLGLHPWFPRSPGTTVQARVSGVWLCGDDPIPTAHTTHFPPGWDLGAGASMHGTLIDNGYSGWDGEATLRWPERGLVLRLTMMPLQTPRGPVPPAWCLIYRPPAGEAFCFEPITQPIDAFHLEGRPGLVELARGEALTLRVRWRFDFTGAS